MVGHADGVDVYMAMRSAWARRIPKVLEKVDAYLLLRLIALADCKDGIAQEVLEKALGINQSRLSKLKDKLVKEKWVQAWRPKDRRKLLIKTTPRAKEIVADLGRALTELALLHRPRPTGKNQKPPEKPRPITLLELLASSESSAP
jgi:DNA-binding MarR family transcriptional regulator